MWSVGFNVSREVLLAIRQSNNQRVEHLIEGLVNALRHHRQSLSQDIGTPLWDFACAVQRLSSFPLGAQKDAFWDEVVHVLKFKTAELQSRELALFCNALASEPAHCATVAPDLLHRAVELRQEMTAQDLQMIVHGLSRAMASSETLSLCAHDVKSLANLVLEDGFELEQNRPLQAAQILDSFARLRHDNDAVLSKCIFDYAQETLPRWDASALTQLCAGLAASRRAARQPLESLEVKGVNGWGRLVHRCVEVLPKAEPWQLAALARSLGKVGAPKVELAHFYDALEERLCNSPRLCELLSTKNLAVLSNALARQRCPLWPERGEEPLTSWQLEEYVGRRVQDFDPPSLCIVLNAAMRLRRGGQALFELLVEPLRLQELEAEQVALLFSAAAAAGPFIGLSPSLQMLRKLMPRCRSLASSFLPWQLAYIAQSLELLGQLRRSDSGPMLWQAMSAAETVEELCQRAEEVVTSREKQQHIIKQLRESVEQHSRRRPFSSSALCSVKNGVHRRCIGDVVTATRFDRVELSWDSMEEHMHRLNMTTIMSPGLIIANLPLCQYQKHNLPNSCTFYSATRTQLGAQCFAFYR